MNVVIHQHGKLQHLAPPENKTQAPGLRFSSTIPLLGHGQAVAVGPQQQLLAGNDATGEQRLGQRVLHLVLDRPLEGTRPVDGIEPGVHQLVEQRFSGSFICL